MTIKIPMHSIIMTIGPSNSGKSFFCDMLMGHLDSIGIRYKYISSDGERRELLNEQLHKHSNDMQMVSKPAFEMLHLKLDVHTRYPINIPVVIVDATNLSKSSRNEIIAYSKLNNYNLIGVLFDYKEKNDYFKYVDDRTDKYVISSMVNKLRNETKKEIIKKDFYSIERIPSIDFSGIEFAFENPINIKYCYHAITEKNVCIVGDIHGCYEEFLEMLCDGKGIALEDKKDGIPVIVRTSDDYVHHILIGDIIDKGPHIEKVIRFVHKNMSWFTMLEGNHERWVAQYMLGVIKKSEENDVLIENYFDTVKLLKEKPDLYEMFKEIYENMATFAYNDKMIITHAPCENKYLGKHDRKSLKAMNHIMYPKKADFDSEDKYLQGMEDFFKFLLNDSEPNYPYHIFGHVMLKSPFYNKNKIGIDLGCVAGGQLGTVIFMEENHKPFIKKYKSKQPTKQLYDLFRTRQNVVSFNSLEHDLQKRIKYCAINGINFISGTMSPVNKYTEAGDIESLSMGIKYFIDKGINQLIIEPKYMGSRANVFIHKTDLSKCKAFSRNAYKIDTKRINSNKTIEQLFEELQNKYAGIFESTGAESILFDGELLPWNAMGKDLIERDFMVAYKAGKSESEILKETGFEKALNNLTVKFEMADAEFRQLKPHEVKMRKEYESFEQDILSIADTESALDKYKHQLDLFGSDGELDFKPFAILKTIDADGKESNWISSDKNNLDMFDMLNDSPYCFIDLDGDTNKRKVYIANVLIDGVKTLVEFGDEEGNISAQDIAGCIDFFWNYITQCKEMEGVVIKPNKAYMPGVAPFLKCRNKEYLRLTYGFDYDILEVKTKRLIDGKSIRRKLETSIKEYELGRQLLDIPTKDISIDNSKWLGLVVNLINEQQGEATLDPRL